MKIFKSEAARCLLLILLCSCLASFSFSRAEQQETATSLDPGTDIKAKLDNAIDVKKVKPGQEISAYTIKSIKVGKKVALPKGTELIGVVREVSYQEGAINESTLKMEFNRIILSNQEMELSTVLIDVGYSMLPSTPEPLFREDEQRQTGTGGLLKGGIEESAQAASHPDTMMVSVRENGTIVVKGAIINLEPGTRITLRLKKNLNIPQ
ncbi:MAG: hypothetical protein AB1756_03475 [Acidobacteriota bacterium]